MSSVSSISANPSQAQQAVLISQIQMAIQAKQLAAARQQGESVVTLLEGALNLAKQSGVGEGLDVRG
jgi:hypothetical protein